jgi:2-polyprenyl-6-methoxyphenol hydroxylase-like FAD-dependent oxidoreductase
MTVLIAGGGIGGLTLALSLHQIGVAAKVFESVSEPKPLGVGINVLPHAVRELIELGLLDRLDASGMRTRELAFFFQARQANLERALNRRNGPEQMMQLVEERAPNCYNVVTDVLSLAELENIAANYKRVAGFQVEGLNAKPPIVAVPAPR